MRALILFQYPHHFHMLITFSNLLNGKGIECDVVCLRNLEYYHNSRVVGISLVCQLAKFKDKIKNDFVRRYYSRFIDRVLFKHLFRQYDLVDLHSYCDEVARWSSPCKEWGVRYDITVWGSDVLRASAAAMEEREDGYKFARLIRGSKNLLNRLSEAYAGRYDDKMREVYFGNSNYGAIDAITEEQMKEIAQKLEISKPNKLTVTCGYNGSREQQHSLILNAVSMLPKYDKEKIHLVIPMSYCLNDTYKEELLCQLEKIGVTYTMIEKFLTIQELASLRLKTDIAINIQTTDAFCAALKEHLYCGNVVVIGDWLDYPIYDSNNIYYIKSSLSHLYDTIKQTIDNFEEIKVHTTGNRIKLLKCTSWQAVLDGWVNAMKM